MSEIALRFEEDEDIDRAAKFVAALTRENVRFKARQDTDTCPSCSTLFITVEGY